MNSINNGIEISKDEAAVYDRQIRLWGIEAQNKLRKSTVLVVGLTQCGSEFVKNVTLAGLNGLTLMDGENVTDEDLGNNFLLLLNNAKIGQNRAEACIPRTNSLNPNVKLSCINKGIAEYVKENEENIDEWFKQFSLIALFDQSYDVIAKVDEICRKLNVRFIAGGVFGWLGYSFHDFNNHNFLMKVQTQHALVNLEEGSACNDPCVTLDDETFELKKLSYASFLDAVNFKPSTKVQKRRAARIPSSFYVLKAIWKAQNEKLFKNDEDHDVECLRKLWIEELEGFNQSVENQTIKAEHLDHFFNPQFTPACAVVGGLVGQEAIKSLSEGKKPLPNLFLFCGTDSSSRMCTLPQ